LAVQLVGNKITKQDINLLQLEEKKRKLNRQIVRNEELSYKEKQKLFQKYKQIKRRIKEIAYTPVGLFNDTQYGHLLRDGKLNLDLLKEWRLNQVEEMSAEELPKKLKRILSKKEYCCFLGVNRDNKTQAEMARELDVAQGTVSYYMKQARRKIKKKYDLNEVVEMLEEVEVRDNSIEAPSEEVEESKEIESKEQSKEEKKPKGIFVAFDDDLEGNDVSQISELITRIEGVSHIAEKSHEVEELKREVASILDRF